MKDHYYFEIIRKTIVQFLDMFNNINIAKYNQNGSIIKYVKVPIKLGMRSKAYQYANDGRENFISPIIAAQLSQISHDSSRIANKNFWIDSGTPDPIAGILTRYLMPIPYNFNFDLHIRAEYMVEMDQILEQILPYFNPQAFIRIAIPELGPDVKFQIKVILTSCNFDNQTSIEEDSYRISETTLGFTTHAYVFQPTEDIDIIKKIIVKFYTTEEGWSHRGTETIYTSGGAGSYESESIFVEGLGYDDSGERLWRYTIFEVDNG